MQHCQGCILIKGQAGDVEKPPGGAPAVGSRQGRLWGGTGDSDSVPKAGWAVRWDVYV